MHALLPCSHVPCSPATLLPSWQQALLPCYSLTRLATCPAHLLLPYPPGSLPYSSVTPSVAECPALLPFWQHSLLFCYSLILLATFPAPLLLSYLPGSILCSLLPCSLASLLPCSPVTLLPSLAHALLPCYSLTPAC